MSNRPPSTPHSALLEVAPAGSALLDVLVELGHLDDRMLEQVNDLLLDLEHPEGVIGLQDVKRIAAQVIFEHQDRLDPELLRVIDQEWGLLFH